MTMLEAPFLDSYEIELMPWTVMIRRGHLD